MSDSIDIRISSSFNAAGAAAATKAIDSLRAALATVARIPAPADPFKALPGSANTAIASTKGVAASLATVGTAAAKTDRSILTLASAQARLQQASGNAAGGVTTLKTAIAQVDQSTVPAIRAMTQLATVENRLSSAKGPTVLPRTIDGLSGSALAAVSAIGAATLALAGLNSAAQALGSVANYEQSLNVLQATAGATDAEMVKVGDTAKALGADLTLPATSAQGAAQAMIALSQQGLTLNDAMAAAKGTLQLAAAGMITEGEAATYTASALNEFGLKGVQANEVADMLAASVGAAGSGVVQTGQAIQQAGASFAAAGIPLADLVTSIDMMSKAGIKGSDAGTSLKAMLRALQAPTDNARSVMQQLGISIYDASGAMKPYRDIISNVTGALKGLTGEQRADAVATIFGSDGQRALNMVLSKGVEAYDAMYASVTKAGAAGILAGAQMKGLNGAVAGLQSQVETLTLNAFEPLLPILAGVVTEMATFAGTASGQVGPAMATLIGSIGTVANFIRDFAVPAIVGLGVATMAYAATQIPALVAALLTQTAALAGSAGAFILANAAAMASVGVYAAVALSVTAAYKSIQDFEQGVRKESETFLATQTTWTGATKALDDYGASTDDAKAKLAPLANKMIDLRSQIDQEIQSYGRREAAYKQFGVASGRTQAQLDEQAASIQTHLGALAQVTSAYNAANPSIQSTNRSLQEQRWGEISGGATAAASAVRLSADELKQLGKELEKIGVAGAKASGDAAATSAGFYASSEAAQAAHEDKIAGLIAEKGKAKTDAARASIAERIAAENEGYATQEAAAATAYATQIAQQQAALGQQLQNYVSAQEALHKLTADQAQSLSENITKQFGVARDGGVAAFEGMKGSIDAFGASGQSNAADVVSSLGAVQTAAAATKAKFDALVAKYAAQVEVTMKGRPPEEIAAALARIPTRVNTEIYITTHDNVGTRSAAAPGGTRATGGPVALNKATLVGEQGPEAALRPDGSFSIVGAKGPELRTFDGPTTIIPADQARALMRSGMAGGGDLNGGATTTTAARPARGTGSRGGDSPGEKILSIAEDTGRKLAEIDAATQAKLADIDAKGAADRLATAQQLNADMATSAADMRVAMETNDFDRFKKGANKKDFAAREAEEKAYYDQIRALQETARHDAATGDAKLAGDTLKIKEEGLNSERSITEKYNAVRAGLSKKDAAALRIEYDQAIAAQQEATGTKVALAQEESAQRGAASDKQKTDVVVAAEDQRAKVVESAQAQAEDVKGATDSERAAVIGNAVAARDGAIAAAQATRDGVNAAYAGIVPPPVPSTVAAPTGNAAPPGGTLATGGPVSVGNATLVGERGPELVVFGSAATVVPADKTRSMLAHGMARGGSVGGGAQINSVSGAPGVATGSLTVDVAITETGRTLQSMTRYISHIAALADFIDKVQSIRASLAVPQSPLDPGAVAQLAKDTQTVALTFAQYVVPGAKLQANAMKGYMELSGKITDTIQKTVDLAKSLLEPRAVITDTVAQELARETQSVAAALGGVVVPASKQASENIKLYADNVASAVGALTSILDLKKGLQDRAMYPVDPQLIRWLAGAAKQVAEIAQRELAPQSEAGATAITNAATGVNASVDAILKVLDLKKGLQDRALYPVDPVLIHYLAASARQVADIVARDLGPSAGDGAESLSKAANAVGSSVDIIKSIIDLKKDLSERVQYAVDPVVIMALAQDARSVTQIVENALLPTTEDQAKALGTYAGAAGSAVGVLKDTMDLKKSLSESVSYPIDAAVIAGIAADGRRVTQIVEASLLPTTEEQAKALDNYSNAVGSSVSALKSTLDLPGKLFTDYTSPSDGDIRQITADANRVTRAVATAAATYDTKGLEGAKLFADAVGGTFTAFKDGLLFFDALKSGDFALDTGALATFEKSTAQTLDTAARLGALAASIPVANLTALERTTALLSSQAEALIRLSAVPWGDLGAATAGLAQSSVTAGGGMSGGGGVTNNFYISGSDPQQVANIVMQKLYATTQMRR